MYYIIYPIDSSNLGFSVGPHITTSLFQVSQKLSPFSSSVNDSPRVSRAAPGVGDVLPQAQADLAFVYFKKTQGFSDH